MKKKRKKSNTNSKKKYAFSETAWKDYTAALVKWKLAYELWQKAGKEALVKYMHVMQSLGPKPELTKQLSNTWDEEWMESGIKQIQEFGKEWQNMLKASGLESIVKFSKDWEKFWDTPGFDSSKTYVEAMKQYTETWQNMWKK